MRGPRGFPFKHAGSPEFPYFTVEGMSFWSRKAFQRHRDIFARFSWPGLATNRRLGKRLLRTLWRGELLGAVNRYKGQRGRRPQSFWSLAIGELPRDLEEESTHARLGDPHFGAQARRDKLDPQILSKHPYYKMAQTVRSQLRFYHRSNGERIREGSLPTTVSFPCALILVRVHVIYVSSNGYPISPSRLVRSVNISTSS